MAYKDPLKEKEWREKNKLHLAEYRKEYVKKEENRETMRAWARVWRQKNSEKIKIGARKWYSEHIEAQRERGRLYREKNPEKAYLRKKMWRINNPEKYQAANHAYMQNNINARIAGNLRSRVIVAIKEQKTQKLSGTAILLGCTIPELKFYIEGKFLEGMNWDNWGRASVNIRTWHIDHIIPCALFDLTNLEQQKRCFNYTNLQPLWALDNLSKGIKLVEMSSLVYPNK